MRIGVDLGGTKIEAVALADDGTILYRQRVPTPAGDYRATLAAVQALVHDLEQALPEHGSPGTNPIGIGTPGAISPASGRLKNSNSVCLNGQPVQQDLETLLGRPLRLANDADCFALSEAQDGAGQGAAVVFGVIVGTGTGAGVVVNGQLLAGPNAIAGEWGHNPLPWPEADEWPGPDCYCGKRGCIETWLSGPGLVRTYEWAGGPSSTVVQMVQRGAAGEERAAAVLAAYADRLARSLATVINILDPEVIVLGGGLANLEYLYTAVPARWGRYVFSDRVDTRLVPARHGDSSGVRGAAWLWPPPHCC